MIYLYKTNGVITVGEDGNVPITYYGKGGKSGKFYTIRQQGSLIYTNIAIDNNPNSSDGCLVLLNSTLQQLDPNQNFSDIQSISNGNGNGATFIIGADNNGDLYQLVTQTVGEGYKINDIITIQGSSMNGTGIVSLQVLNVTTENFRFLINIGGDNYDVSWQNLVIDGTSPTSFSNANDLLLTLFS